MFLEYDIDGDGRLDRHEFIQLLKRISPKARSDGELHLIRDLIARERLQKHIGEMRLAAEGECRTGPPFGFSTFGTSFHLLARTSCSVWHHASANCGLSAFHTFSALACGTRTLRASDHAARAVRHEALVMPTTDRP